MKTEHSVLPWHADSIDQVRTKSGIVIARCERKERHEYMGSREQSSNAAFIVRACNAHDDLVAALERALRIIGNGGSHNGAQLEFMESALSKARGE